MKAKKKKKKGGCLKLKLVQPTIPVQCDRYRRKPWCEVKDQIIYIYNCAGGNLTSASSESLKEPTVGILNGRREYERRVPVTPTHRVLGDLLHLITVEINRSLNPDAELATGLSKRIFRIHGRHTGDGLDVTSRRLSLSPEMHRTDVA